MKFNCFRKKNLARQILGGYVVIIVVALSCALFCISTLKINQDIDKQISEVNLPLILNLKDLKTLSNEMGGLSNNWVYKPNASDKEKLLSLINTEVPEVISQTKSILNLSEDKGKDSISVAFTMLKELSENELKITRLLADDSLYSNDVVVDESIKILESNVQPASVSLDKLFTKMIESQDQKMKEAQDAKKSSYSVLTYLFIFMIVASLVTAILAYNSMNKNVVEPIKNIRDVLFDMGKGKVIQMSSVERDDELGEMYGAMVNLTNGISAQSTFANQIGLGKYDEDFQLQSEDDVMGSALLTMRSNLKKNAEEERKRSWATIGIAEIGTILREQTSSTKELYDNILRFVITYTKSNQGGLFLLNNEEHAEACLELVSTYAYERKKFIDKKISLGEGLVGQCVLEGDTIFLTEIPNGYVRITSGLGEATPNCLLIVPLKINDVIHGVLEIASFNIFEDYQVAFIEKLTENIASTISNVRINERTKILLESTQQQAEEMRSQEEEMKQNMEELSATQEEMNRKENDYLKKIAELEAQLESVA